MLKIHISFICRRNISNFARRTPICITIDNLQSLDIGEHYKNYYKHSSCCLKIAFPDQSDPPKKGPFKPAVPGLLVPSSFTLSFVWPEMSDASNSTANPFGTSSTDPHASLYKAIGVSLAVGSGMSRSAWYFIAFYSTNQVCLSAAVLFSKRKGC